VRVARVIPCLDVDNGRVVKGVQYIDHVDAGDPVELARRYDEQGADEVFFLDITASSDGRNTIVELATRAAEALFIPLTIGGGVRSVGDARALLRAGADKVAVNSAAVARPDVVAEIAEEFGSQCVVVAIDAKRRQHPAGDPTTAPESHVDTSAGPGTKPPQPEGYESAGRRTSASQFEVYVKGGREATGIDAIEWARRVCELGAGEIMLTSMDRDGTRDGFDLELTAAVSDAVPVPVIASGGVGTLDHLADGIIAGRADAVLAASIFHFGEHTVAEAKELLMSRGITVRPPDA